MSDENDRLTELYDRLILRHPYLSLFLLIAVLAGLISFLRHFRVDASGDSLIMQQDEDLQYYRKINRIYDREEFVVITYTPPEPLFSESSLDRLKRLRNELREQKEILSVMSILDVPLLQNPPGSLETLKSRIKTLSSPQADKKLAIREFRNSPLYQNLIVSSDLKTTALLVKLPLNESFEKLDKRRGELRQKKYQSGLTVEEQNELQRIQKEYRSKKETVKQERHERVQRIRSIVSNYRSEATLHLGGVPVVSDNVISYIKHDIKWFSVGVMVMIVLILVVLFRSLQWVLFPVLCCLFSGLSVMGLLGLMGWKVTVVSANFISLQLIFTMSLVIHILVRYREFLGKNPDAPQASIISKARKDAFTPCLYASLTTSAGFSSLIASDLLPVINFGWIMCIGVLVALALTFLFLPPGLMMSVKPDDELDPYQSSFIPSVLAWLTEHRRGWIVTTSIVVAGITAYGMSQLKVENSFVNYFKSSTEVYQGLKFIDRNLGGTTPLDVIVTFPSEGKREKKSTSERPPAEDSFSEFEEYDRRSEKDRHTYWITVPKMKQINRIHNYLDRKRATGKVRSLATVWQLGKTLNNGKPLDNLELQVLLKNMPDDVQENLIDRFVSIENDQVRVTTRIQDTLPGLNRDQLIEDVKRGLVNEAGLKKDQFRFTGLMILYNNMLQSLFRSQMETIGLTVLLLLFMFWILFRSVKIALIAIFPNLLASVVVLGVMGLTGIPLDIMTITIVAISVGIAVDDTIHYLHRFQKEFKKDRDYIATMHRSHGTIGNAMTYTTITITVGFSILVVSKFIPTVLFGLLTALAMIIALLAALTLLPSLILFFQPFGPGTGSSGS